MRQLPSVCALVLFAVFTSTSVGRACAQGVTAFTAIYFEQTVMPAAPTLPLMLPKCAAAGCIFIPDHPLPDGLQSSSGPEGIRIFGTPTGKDNGGNYTMYMVGLDKDSSFSFPITVTTQLPQFANLSLVPPVAVTLPPGHIGFNYATKIAISKDGKTLCSLAAPSTGGAPALPLGLSLDASGILSSAALGPLPVQVVVQCALAATKSTFTIPAPPAPLTLATAPTDISDKALIAKLAGLPPELNPYPHYDNVCQYEFNDCDWRYTMVGGFEQSDLSSQDSQTNAFVDFIVRAPENTRAGFAWTQVRLLGAPNTSNSQNIVNAITNPNSTTTASIDTVGFAIDYVAGFEHDWFQPKARAIKPRKLYPTNPSNTGSGMFTLGAIAAFGATTPLSSESATLGYAVPNFGTNECTELQARFQTKSNSSVPGQLGGYNPPLPPPGMITTTTTVGSNASTSVTSPEYCSVISAAPAPTSTTSNGVTTVIQANGTQITNIALTPQDRSSFLLKYMVGVRLVNRWHVGNSSRCSGAAPDGVRGPCTRSIVDFTLGQDQAITGGYWRHVVFKSDVIFPIPGTGFYFFGSSAIRLEKNKNQSPLILTPTPFAATNVVPGAGQLTIPSPSVFVLPLKQSDRDFYRIGLALDLTKFLTKLFQPI